MKNFKRAYRLIAGTTGTMGFEIGAPDVVTGRSLHINFEVERGDSESNNTATIKIYNLSPQSLAVLEQDNCVVDLQAGYDGDMATIIQGTVSHIDSAHEGADTCTEIGIVDGLVATRDSNVSVSYRGSVNGKKILTDAAANMGCAILFSPNCTFPSFKNFSFVGSATTLFHQVCDASNTNFSIQNGVVQVCAANEAITAMAYVLSAETGLIGHPERLYDNASTSNSQNANTTKRKTQTGWKVSFLMNGHIQANDYIMLSSKLATGAFRVSKIDTKGDSEGSGEDSWVCVAELLEVK